MDPLLIVGVAGFILLVAVQMVAGRRIAMRRSRWVWVAFGPFLAAGILMPLMAAPHLIAGGSPAIGLLVGGFVVAMAAVMVRFVVRLKHSIDVTPPGGDPSDAFFEPLAEFSLTYVGLMLLGAVVLGFAALVLVLLGQDG